MVDDLHLRLRERGFRDVRPSYGFVLLEARSHPLGVVDVARLMGVTKQAASKLVDSMVGANYLRDVDADDARARLVTLSPRGRRLLSAVEEIYRELEAEWAQAIGSARVEALRDDLVRVLEARHGGLPSVRPAVAR
ncbi:MarR family transcriptional regulator [Rudaea sp.]|uniref:MarR family winged helix-turn-helix transcriptional regulator n=1 Tax=Rudaea sp. TaxID=2136325 RepID=UPI00321F989E